MSNEKFEFYSLKDLKNNAPKLFGVPTYTKIDEMFYNIVEEDGKFVKKPLNGIPYLSVLNITGIPDTGKSLFGEQFALVQASLGYKVLYVTVESPAEFLYSSFKLKAKFLNLNFDDIENNIFVIDASKNDVFRENHKYLLDTMAFVIKEKKTTITVIDSITGLYEHKEVMARQIVRLFYNFLKKYRQTSILISQKRSSQSSDSAEAAGGLAVAHIVDGSIVFDKKVIDNKWDSNLYGLSLGNVLRTLRIDGCRITGHDSKTYVFEITDGGTINILMPLEEFIKKNQKK